MPARRLLGLFVGVLLAWNSAAWGDASAVSSGPNDALAASPDAPWGRSQAAHLLRRAGFGGTPEQIDVLVRAGRDRAVESLVDFARSPDPEPGAPGGPAYPRGTGVPALRPDQSGQLRSLTAEQRRELTAMVRRNEVGHLNAVRDWWLARMVATHRPLQEKMVLFWHGHFTSGYREVRDWRAIYDQNELFRAHALGRFGELVQAVCRDPAMLRYLDNARNVKGRPNENFARELMELFTLGEGHYTEQDVREAARAFTGWTVGPDGRFLVRPRQHDDGTKVFLGRRGNLDGDDVVRTILAQPAASRYLATRLWEFFAYADPEPQIIDALAGVLRRTDFDLAQAMRAMLRSDAFYGPRAVGALIKGPVELVVGSARLLEVELGQPRAVAYVCRQLGQEVFQPPNVKGWPGGRTWITTSTLFVRYNFAGLLLYGGGRPAAADPDAIGTTAMREAANRDRMKPDAADPPMRRRLDEILGPDDSPLKTKLLQGLRPPPEPTAYQPPYDPGPTLKRFGLTTAGQVVDHYVDRMLQTALPADRRRTLVQTLAPDGRPFDPTGPQSAVRIRSLLYLVMSMPEYQVQ